MSYHPRIETDIYANFLTTRARNSELWFINNKALEDAILGYAAKYSTIHNVSLYALAIEGNHIQGPAHFPLNNRASYMRDFNSAVAKAVPRYTAHYPGGKLWARRYSNEFLPSAEDIEEYFFYTVLQPVQDGLVERISDYPGYNCFHDAVNGIGRTKEVVNWSAYYEAKRVNPNARRIDYIVEYTLEFKRLPGYENLSQKEYSKIMYEKLEKRRAAIVKARKDAAKGFAGRSALLQKRQGSTPSSTKTSTSKSHRPRVLCVCPQRRAETIDWYFRIYYSYKSASEKYRAGDNTVEFPPGTYKPVCVTIH